MQSAVATWMNSSPVYAQDMPISHLLSGPQACCPWNLSNVFLTQGLGTHYSFFFPGTSFYKIFSWLATSWNSQLSSNVTSWKRTSFIILSKKPYSPHSLSHLSHFHYFLKLPHLFVYMIIICSSLFECKLNVNIKTPCRVSWMDSSLSQKDTYGVCNIVKKNRCGFCNLERNCKDVRCNIVWHYSLLSKIFFPSFSPT